ncbi:MULTISPECIES: TetR/AcrR family transcriptional regulator [unclassified Lentimicrobium]|uniref:TetR/AcrR family transcriptional regulator n=1 Tax=unclassified Lentimicrobium TaxID=2677434 RepID=UPI0015526E2C|nr:MULTISPECIES: TetR/AcrR family transcriptional regulator [unclassified Lentimicrobium]NPD44247.1 TetR family transcriptional regulator [Lentimicrobium sp. S6]NPD85785.1 TetR family transcriptional regulator [Lentimicrobium sp. L6]
MPGSDNTKKLWIEKGYEHFALFGPENLSINKISKEIESSRACFYHYFGDIDIFMEELLNLHIQITQEFDLIGKRECKKLLPDLYLLLEKHPIPLKFCRQLFINRSNSLYNTSFNKAYRDSSNTFALQLFTQQYGLKNNAETFNLWATVGDSWYSRLDINDLSAKKMQEIAEEVLNSVFKFVSSELYSSSQAST